MTDEDRKRTMLGWEGQVLECAGRSGVDDATSYIQAQIDGLVNGLIRLNGAEPVASFLFKVADRAAGGVRGVTVWMPKPPEPSRPSIAVQPNAVLPAGIAFTFEIKPPPKGEQDA